MDKEGVGRQSQTVLEKPKLTEQQQGARDIFYRSFMFSQGSEDLQAWIGRWLKKEGYLNGRFLYKMPSYVKDIAPPKKHTIFTVDTKFVRPLRENWETFRSIKQQIKDLYSLDKIQQGIFTGMVARDLHFQEISRPGRPLITDQVTPDGSNDPHASFVRKYILNGAPTGNDAFDALHRSLVPLATHYQRLSIPDQMNTDDQQQEARSLNNLQKMWEKHHPGDTFFPADNVR